jgi:hypothetical protein
MEDFLKTMYEKPPEESIMNSTLQLFAKYGWHAKEQLVGVLDADIDGLCSSETPIPVKVMMRAAARFVNAASNARLGAGASIVSTDKSPTPNPLSGVSASQVQEIVGAEWSAATVAKLMNAGAEEIDVAKNLKDANMSTLPYHLQCDKAVWKILDAENKAAKAAGRKAFAYVDLTAKEVLPIWLPQDAIGGKSLFGSDWQPSDAAASSLAELGDALQAASSQRKIFRSISQWLGAFIKYAATAIPMKQMSNAGAFAYMNVVMKIHEEEKDANGAALVSVIYDDVFRKMIARQAEAKDPGLDFDAEFSTVDKNILEAC